MGGHAAGDVACQVVIAALAPLDADAPPATCSALGTAVRGQRAPREVVHEAPQLEGMGTTLTALLFAGGRLALVPRRRLPRLPAARRRTAQITHDDTFVQSLIDDGRITPEEATPPAALAAAAGAERQRGRARPLHARGPGRRPLSDLLRRAPRRGLRGGHRRGAGNPDPEATADRLIQLALLGGGPDNITVIVADVMDTGVGSARTRSSTRRGRGHGRAAPGRPPFGRRPGRAGRPARGDPDAAHRGRAVAAPRRAARGGGALVRSALWSCSAAAGVGSFFWVLSHWFVGARPAGRTRTSWSSAGWRLDRRADLRPGRTVTAAVTDLVPAARNQVVRRHHRRHRPTPHG